MRLSAQPLQVFIFAPTNSAMHGASKVVEEAGHAVLTAGDPQGAASILADTPTDAILVENSAVGEAFVRQVRETTDQVTPTLVLVRSELEDPEGAVDVMMADGYLIHPFSAATLGSVLSVAQRLCQVRHELDIQSKDQPLQVRRLASAINSRTGFYQFEAIKDLLVVEVRRAKRYGYPLAILLVGLDSVAANEELNRPSLQREITAGLAVAIAKSIRDIDIPIHFADDRILAFLPHTDMAGAEEVGRRVKRRLKRITYRGEGLTAQLTASVGVAGISEGESLTFSRLIKDASAALKVAQLKGGDRVMKRVPRNPSG